MSKSIRNLSFVFYFVVTILLLTACAGQTGNVTPAVDTAQATQTEDATQEPQINAEENIAESDSEVPAIIEETPVGGFIVTDQAGREVYINSPVERLASGFFISTSAIIALDLTDRLVSVESRVEDRPLFVMSAPELLELPSTGTARDFSLEAAAAVEPDLAILPLRLTDEAEILTALGIPVILVHPESHEELVEMIELIAKATGTEERARQLLDHYETQRENITNKLRDVTNLPVVYMGGNSSYLTTAPRDMYQASLIQAAGGINAAHGIEGRFWTDISYEEFIALNPEIIVIPSEAAYSRYDILENPILAYIDAVANGRVYAMPDAFEAWDAPVPSGILGLSWMLHVLHPDLYSLEELQTDAAAFYREFYGIEIDITLITP